MRRASSRFTNRFSTPSSSSGPSLGAPASSTRHRSCHVAPCHTQSGNTRFLSNLVAALRGDRQATDAVYPAAPSQHSGFHSTESEVGYPLIVGNGDHDGADIYVFGDCSYVGTPGLSTVVLPSDICTGTERESGGGVERYGWGFADAPRSEVDEGRTRARCSMSPKAPWTTAWRIQWRKGRAPTRPRRRASLMRTVTMRRRIMRRTARTSRATTLTRAGAGSIAIVIMASASVCTYPGACTRFG